jgi:hypothetical protein
VIFTGDRDASNKGIDRGSSGLFCGGFAGYEAGWLTMDLIRWSEKFKAGRVSDLITAILDWFPILANLVR